MILISQLIVSLASVFLIDSTVIISSNSFNPSKRIQASIIFLSLMIFGIAFAYILGSAIQKYDQGQLLLFHNAPDHLQPIACFLVSSFLFEAITT